MGLVKIQENPKKKIINKMVEVIASGPIHKNDGWSEDPCSVFVAHFVDSLNVENETFRRLGTTKSCQNKYIAI